MSGKTRKVQHTGPSKGQRWFESIDPALSADERASLIEQSAKRYFDATKDISGDFLPAEDVELLLEHSKDADPRVRKTAVSVLLDGAELDWEAIEKWALDPEKDVREEVLSRLMFIDHDEGTIEWYIWLLSEVIERYADGQAGIALSWLSTQSEKWLDLTWQAAGELLDLDNKEATSLITIGYLESVLHFHDSRGPEDPHVAAWIKSDNKLRKKALLEVVDWLRGYDNIKKIAAALADDPDPEIAERARKLA